MGETKHTDGAPGASMTFADDDTFGACRAAERWLVERGFSYGRMQGPSPRGILYGDYDIQKWRNLDRRDIAALDGVMTGNMRHGPVHITIYPTASAEAKAALAAGAAT